MMPKPTRKRWIVKHPIQIKYIAVVVVAMAAPALVVGGCLYYLVVFLLARQMAFPEAILANLVPVIERMNLILLVSLPPLLALIFALAVGISHRFAGPIERIESELDEIAASGDAGRRMRLRGNDDWMGLTHRINRILEMKDKQ